MTRVRAELELGLGIVLTPHGFLQSRGTRHLGVRPMLRGVVRTAFQLSVIGGMLTILLMFVFERQVDNALELIGYDRSLVSYVPFIRNLHLRFVLYYSGVANLDVAHFHMLDVALLLSMTVWGAWLTAGIIFLKRCDDDFRLFCVRVWERYRGRHLALCVSWVFVLSCPVILSTMPRMPVTNPELLLMFTYIPRFYFFMIALAYFLSGGLLFGLSILLLVWKAFRLIRPCFVVLERAQKGKKVGS